MTKKIALVVQRYGEDIIGGAEAHARILAERLVADLGWRVTVMTTRAKSYETWANAYESSQHVLNGVDIKRFSVVFPRWPNFGVVSRVLLKLRAICLRLGWTGGIWWLESLWIIAQGPYCPALIKFLKKNQSAFDHILFMTYLYYPTIKGLQVVDAEKSVFIPTAHDEPAFYFEHTRSSFSRAHTVFANSMTEKSLIESRYDCGDKVRIVGLGIDRYSVNPQKSLTSDILYLGRISRGKGVDQLIEWFMKASLPGVRLVLAGLKEENINIPADPAIQYLGTVTSEHKQRLFSEVAVLINPSPLESLSLVVLEAAAACLPIVVNRRCEIFAYYEKQLPTVFGYDDHSELTQQVQRALRMSRAGPTDELVYSQEWVERNYGWTSVLRHFRDLDKG